MKAHRLSYICPGLEQDICLDPEVRTILQRGLTAEALYSAASRAQNISNSSFFKLPVALTSESQAFGAVPVIDEMGVRISAPPYQNLQEILAITPSSLNDGFIKEIMDSVRMAENKYVVFKLKGPVSVLADLIGTVQVYRSMKKEKETLHEVLTVITDWLTDYARAGLQAGSALISFADSCGSDCMLGNQEYVTFSANYQIRLFRALLPLLEKKAIHICGRTSVGLENSGLMKSIDIPCRSGSFAENLIEKSTHSDFQFCGHSCLLQEHLHPELITKLELNVSSVQEGGKK